MSKEVVSALPEETLAQVLTKMKERGVHEIPIVNGKRHLGMVMHSVLAKHRNLPLSTQVGHVMVQGASLSPEETLPNAAEIMMGGSYAALPVVRKGELVGILSRTDLTRAVSESKEFEGLLAKDVMTPNPQTVRLTDGVQHARSLMKGLDERSIPVVDEEGKLVGSLGIQDLTAFLERERDNERPASQGIVRKKVPLDTKVGDLMNSNHVTASPDEPLPVLAKRMVEHAISSLVVVENAEPVGIVTKQDVLEVLTRLRPVEGVLVKISGIEEEPGVYEGLYAIIERSLKRISRLARPHILNVHIVQHQGGLDNAKYSVRARLTTEHRLFYTNAAEWDVFRAMDETMRQFELQVRKVKDIQVTSKRSRR